MKESWQSSELKKFYKQHQKDDYIDAKSVHLTNPEFSKKIDETIANNVWTAVKDAISDTTIHAALVSDDKDIYSNIEDKWHTYVARAFTFLLSDPERPIGTYNTQWLCRSKVRCSAIDYIIKFEFHIFFPSDFDMTKILKLLKSPEFVGMPPELTYEEDIDGFGLFILKFTKGTGSGGSLLNYANVAKAEVYSEVIKNLDVIYALNTLEIDYNRSESFQELYEALVVAYGSK